MSDSASAEVLHRHVYLGRAISMFAFVEAILAMIVPVVPEGINYVGP